MNGWLWLLALAIFAVVYFLFGGPLTHTSVGMY